MKKFATLALAMLVIPSVNSFAASENNQINENNQKMEMKSERKEQKENQMDLYEVIEVFDNSVTLKFIETLNGNQIPTYNGAEFNVAKEKFSQKDIKIGDRFKITHDDIIMPSNPAQFGKIFAIEKVESNSNENDDVKEEQITENFVVEKVNENGYTIADIKNLENKYNISKKEANNMDLNIGDKLEITHNGVILESYPAQFGKIIEVLKYDDEEKEEEKPEDNITETFIVENVSDGGYTIYEKSNKDNKYFISKDDTKSMDLMEGDEIEITHTGLATRSYPAQFVGEIKVRKLDAESKEKMPAKDKKEDSKIKNEDNKDVKPAGKVREKDLEKSKMDIMNKEKMESMDNKMAGENPKTGILSSIGLVGSSAVAIALAKKIRNYQ